MIELFVPHSGSWCWGLLLHPASIVGPSFAQFGLMQTNGTEEYLLKMF